MNAGVAQARAEHVCVMVDGARMVSPGLIAGLLAIFGPTPMPSRSPWAGTSAHSRRTSILQGYNQGVEDRMLEGAMAGGWLPPVCNFQPGVVTSGRLVCADYGEQLFALKRHHFQALGGFDERFVAPGGGLVNLIFSARRLPPSSPPGCCWGGVSIRSMAAWPPTCRWSSIQAWPSPVDRSAVSPTSLRSTTLNNSVRSPSDPPLDCHPARGRRPMSWS